MLEFDKNIDITQQIVYHNQKYNGNFNYFRKENKLINTDRCAEIHIYDDNEMILLTQHSITDGRYIQDLIQHITTKQPLKLELPDSQYDIFKDQYNDYKKKYDQGYYQIKNFNNFEVIDVNQPQQLYVEKIVVDSNQKQWLKHRFTQKIILVNSLLKLYVLKKQNKLNNIKDLLEKGIIINQPYVADARKYDIKKDSKYGCCVLRFDENYILKGKTTVEEYTKYFTQQLQIRQNNNEMYYYLKICEDAQQQKYPKPNYHIIESYTFSNAGRNNTDFYQDIDLGFYMNIYEQTTQPTLFIYSLNGIIKLTYYCPQKFQNYNLSKIIMTLLENIKDNKTINELWKEIADQ